MSCCSGQSTVKKAIMRIRSHLLHNIRCSRPKLSERVPSMYLDMCEIRCPVLADALHLNHIFHTKSHHYTITNLLIPLYKKKNACENPNNTIK